MRTKIVIVITMMALTMQGQNTKRKMSGTQADTKKVQQVTIVNFEKLEAVIKKNDNKLYVVNFWATWCKPCVMELPDFMEVNKAYQHNPNFRMILVSLDLAKEAVTDVKPFLAKHNIEAEVYLLDDNKRMNQWIPAVDNRWSGAIPATVIYRNGKKLDFKESKLSKNELEQLIHTHL